MSQIAKGDKIPQDIEFQYIPIDISQLETLSALSCQRPISLKLNKLFESKGKVLIVAVPGAFTPTCTENHIPPYLKNLKELKTKLGITNLLIVAFNDAFVLNAWGKLLLQQNITNKDEPEIPHVYFVSDGTFSKSIGLLNTETGRTQRYALIIDQTSQTVEYVGVEVERGVKYSGLDAVLSSRL
ncbi:Redoxin [Scheffersomyces coipomensis]|uniref:Redoxin n=1 Tax=Scheffersomyces coipomensis TaxID=1788519 RepID=UPI00315C8D78